MKRGFRYQTGEVKGIAVEIKNGRTPDVEIDNEAEFKELINDLKLEQIFWAEEVQLDKTAVDNVKYPEFQYRAEFYIQNDKTKVGYADFYTEDPPEETYADVFGD